MPNRFEKLLFEDRFRPSLMGIQIILIRDVFRDTFVRDNFSIKVLKLFDDIVSEFDQIISDFKLQDHPDSSYIH